jgi:hypothetical protein
MSTAGFKRRRDSLAYYRTTEDATQAIDVAIEHHPNDEPNAAAVIYPQYTIVMDRINETVEAMTDGSPQLGGRFDITLHGPIEWTSPKGVGARWYIYQCNSIPTVISSIRNFLVNWTIPFLDRFRRDNDLCSAKLEGDARDVHSQMDVLRVVAAKSLCGQSVEALAVMDQWFGKSGPRRRYRPVFEYLARR